MVTVEPPRTAKLCAEPSIDVAKPEAGRESSAANIALVKIFIFISIHLELLFEGVLVELLCREFLIDCPLRITAVNYYLKITQ